MKYFRHLLNQLGDARRKTRSSANHRTRKRRFEQLESRHVLANAIVAENLLPGNPASEWDIGETAGDPALQGFATEISVDQGQTVSFKITNTANAAYSIDIYRIGYYQGNGARKVATIPSTQTVVRSQPAPLYNAAIGLLDAGNWSVTASWAVPANAVSGVYIARLRRVDNGAGSHIIFVVRDDNGGSDLLFQTSDTTWQAYNLWGGSSFYAGPFEGRTYAISYNRPFNTRAHTAKDWFFGPEYATVRWLEANGYDVSYTTGVDTARRGAEILEHKVFLSVGHDEYWSQEQRANVEAARDAGISLAFFSGNEIYWKTRWSTSIDSSGQAFRTLISYKETWDDAKIDPLSDVWTGTWRDPRFSPPADGGRPENALTGQIFTVNRGPGGDTGTPFTVPSDYAAMRFWRDTRVASLTSGETATVGDRVLGYEWDEDLDNGFRPAGLIRMSSTTQQVPEKIDEYGRRNVSQGTATHSLTLYRASSGALVFGAGTVNWGFGLDGVHDVIATTADAAIQQATVNLFADMGVQPETLQSNLVRATMSTDVIAPTSTITSVTAGAIFQTGVPVVLTGTASDQGGVVGGVEISVDGGLTWRRAEGRNSWSYTFVPSRVGPTQILSRAADDSGNIEAPSAINATVQLTPTSNTGLVAAYNFNQTSGSTLLDSSGQNNHGSIAGALWVSGFAGNALSFDGLNDMVTVADANSLDLTTGLTIEAWVRPADLNGWTSIAAKEYGSNDASYILYASDYTNQPPASYLNLTSGNGFLTGGSVLTLNSWSHVAVSYNGSQINLYVNGQLVDTRATTSAIVTGSGVLRIGGNTVFANEYFNGLIDELRIYNRGLTQTEIQYNMSRPVGGALDANAPTGTLTVPSGSLSGTVSLNVNATDNVGIAGVQYLVNGQPISSEDSSYPYQLNWQTTTFANGTYALSARIRDFAGNTLTTPVVNKQISNPADTIAPSLAIAYLENGEVVSGNVVLTAFAFDNVKVVGVRYQIDGVDLGLEDTAAPYRSVWNTTNVSPGTHLITAVARDAAGNTTSRSVSVSIDNTAPTVTAQTPGSGAANVPSNTQLSATFSEAMQPGAFVLVLEDSHGARTTTTNTYNPSTRTVTFVPQQSLGLGATYTAKLLVARDLAGNNIAPLQWSFTTSSTITNASFWNSGVVPQIASDSDTDAVELGVKFRATIDGYLTGLRFYKGPGNTGTHIGHLWRADGTLLATATFLNETATGWQQANFSTPVPITAGVTYVASYFAPNGGYAVNPAYFTAGFTSGPLVVPSTSEGGGNGVYRYGTGSLFPNQTYNASNYWIDVVFSTTIGDVVAPTVTSFTPTANATGVATAGNLAATWNEPVQANTIVFQLRNAANQLVAANVTYDNTTRTVTLDPNQSLADFTTYTATLSGAKDAAGNTMAPLSWTFTTGGVDSTPPAIVATTPPTGATSVAPSAKVVVSFSEPIDLNSVLVSMTAGEQNVPVGVWYDSVNNTALVYMIPADGLPGGCCGACSHCPLNVSTFYSVRFAGVRDLAGNEMAPYTWTFTTAASVTNVSIWDSQAVPATPSISESDAVELGVKFQVLADGYITGMRFYKGAGNTGTHVGHLWSAAGQVLGTATFVNETATGWQQVNFPAPVLVTAGTTYVASYYAPNGGYAYTPGYFNSGEVSNGPLQFLANSAGGNGVYRYGSGGGFPDQTYNASNYWVDVVYSNNLGDLTPPELTGRTPAPGATQVNTALPLSITFNETIQFALLNFTLRSAGGETVPATTTYNAATNTVTLSPNAPLNGAAVYTVVLNNVRDLANNALADSTWSFTTAGQVSNASIWSPASVPAIASVTDVAAIELGVKFQADRNGFITGLRYYKGPGNTGTHVGHLWTAAGELLATATFAQESESGWQQVNFDLPIAITANTTYVASYYAPSGGYSASVGYFGNTYTNSALRALSSTEAGGNGVYRYGVGGGFPTTSSSSTNYWIDVVFNEVLVDSVAPTVIDRSPAASATSVGVTSNVAATLSEAVQPGTIVFELRNSAGVLIPAAVTYNSLTRTVTLDPTSSLANGASYTATLSGAKDAAGNVLATTSWSFRTVGQWLSSTTADFTGGTHSGTIVSTSGDGAIHTAPLLNEEFSGTSLGSAWQSTAWVTGSSVVVSGSQATIRGAMVASTQVVGSTAVEARLTFGATSFQHFGLATGLDTVAGNSWAIFSTNNSTSNLYARINIQGVLQDVNLGSRPTGMHNYKVEPTPTGFVFSIDGVVVTTIARVFAPNTSARVAFSAYNAGSSPALIVDWVRTASYATNAIYQSAVYDAGLTATWKTINWTAQVPTGAGLQVEVSFSNDTLTGWTNWSNVTSGDSLGNVLYRYARYRVTFTSSGSQTATLFDLTMNWE